VLHMAGNTQNFKKLWPVMLLAAALAERAHAPLMGRAHASDAPVSEARPAAAVSQPRPGAKRSSKPDVQGRSSAAPVDRQKVAEKLKELEPEKSVDPLTALLLATPYGNFGSDAGRTVLDSVDATAALPVGGADYSAGGLVDGDISGEARYAEPVDSQTTVYDGSGFYSAVARQPVVTTPQPEPQVTVAAEVSVPEPGVLPAVLGGMMVVGFGRRRIFLRGYLRGC
jgi:hypothetical protein